MTKKLSLLIFCAIFSMFFVISCSSDDEEDMVVDTEGNSSENDDQNGNNNGDNADENGSENNQNSENTNENTDNSDQNDNDINENNNDVDENTVDNDPNGTGDNENNGVNDSEIGDDSDNGDSQQSDADADTGDTGSNQGDDGNLSNSDASQTAQPGKIGAACTDDDQCTQTYGSGDSSQEALCLFESSDGFPGGYCSFLSTGYEEDICGSTGEVFYNFGGESLSGTGLCLHRCTQPSDCRKGYRCSNKIHACLPDCNKTGYKCVYGQCDTTDGVCVKK